MDCPYCDVSASRMSLHSHLVEEHTDEIEREGATCRLRDPTGDGDNIEATVDTGDGETVERFSNEVAMLVFDRLLDRLEERK
ncbi:MAG: hypothetical protein ACLFR5_03500 [Halobacteriales archaeon]